MELAIVVSSDRTMSPKNHRISVIFKLLTVEDYGLGLASGGEESEYLN